ncbi:MAG: SGNH/GDSL hydrolase family protein [Nitrospirae bacterium]|nr:SGNH/GDSL hydrolase family protein [Nitrospirota bacterium]
MERIKRLAGNVGLLIVAVLITLAIVEIALRFTPFNKQLEIFELKGYLTGDNASIYDIVKNYPPATFNFYEMPYTVWSNELGCYDSPYKGEKDYVLIVGDSFTWGFTPYERLFPRLIETYTGTRVLKCGVMGYGTKQELMKIKKVTQEVMKKSNNKPALIITAYFIGNDLVDDLHFYNKTARKDANSPAQPSFLRRIRRPNTMVYKHSAIYRLHEFIMDNNKLYRRLKLRLGFHGEYELPFLSPEKYPMLGKAWEINLENIKQMQLEADALGAKFVIVLIPTREQVYTFLRPYDLNWVKPNEILTEFLKKTGIMYLDLTPIFTKYADQTPRESLNSQRDLYWRHDRHLNLKGHRLMAISIVKYLLENGLLYTEYPAFVKQTLTHDINQINLNQ